jgi:hypothetical protein
MLRLMRILAAMLVLCGLGLLVSASAGAVPKLRPSGPTRLPELLLTTGLKPSN